jgi:hypothetical protein
VRKPAPKPKGTKKISTDIKDRKFLSVYLGAAKMNGCEAVRILHPEATAEGILAKASHYLARTKPMICKWIKENELDDDALRMKLAQLMNAEQKVFFAHQGNVVSERTVPDWSARKGGLEIAYKYEKVNAGTSEELNQLIIAGVKRLAELALGKSPIAPDPDKHVNPNGGSE